MGGLVRCYEFGGGLLFKLLVLSDLIGSCEVRGMGPTCRIFHFYRSIYLIFLALSQKRMLHYSKGETSMPSSKLRIWRSLKAKLQTG